jgi:hypothetical protein
MEDRIKQFFEGSIKADTPPQWRDDCDPQIIVDGFTGLIGRLEFNWPAGLLLPNRRSVDCIAVRCHVIKFEGDHVAAAKLARISTS